MSGALCRATWAEADRHSKAAALDAAFPNCACEAWSLVAEHEPPIGGPEPLARVLTTPGMYDAGQILTQKLTAAWAGGVSVIRAGAPEAEIRDTIAQLLHNGAEPQTLLGAVVFSGMEVAAIGAPERHFGTYHTPDGTKTHHADVLATKPPGSRTQQRKIESVRRGGLRDFLQPRIIFEQDTDALVSKLRAAGI